MTRWGRHAERGRGVVGSGLYLRPTLDFEFVYSCLAFGCSCGVWSPAIDQALAGLVAYSDRSVEAFADTGFEAGSDAGALFLAHSG